MYQQYKVKIKVNNIQHLTDARYFAAMGVNYMGFDLSGLDGDEIELEFTKIAAIRDWVSGPELFISVDRADEEILELALKNKLNIIEVSHASPLFGHEDFQWFYRNGLSEKGENTFGVMDFDTWKESNYPEVFVRGFGEEELLEIIERKALGVELEGSPEEKIGVKSYEFYDHVLNELEEN